MDKAKFYLQIPQYFNGKVICCACGVPLGRTIPGSLVFDYCLLCLTALVESNEVSLWITKVDSDEPVAEIRIGEAIDKQLEQSDMDFLLACLHGELLISFNLTEMNTDVKQRLQLLNKSLDTQVISAVESLIDGVIANFKSL